MTPDELAESMIPVACDLACRVRDGDADGIERLTASLSGQETAALLVVLAAMVPVEDSSPADLLAWTGGLEVSLAWRQDALPDIDCRCRELEPCGTYAAYRRHLRRGEPADETCHLAYQEYHRVQARESMARLRERRKDEAAREDHAAAA